MFKNTKEIYPLTIFKDRYSGTYSKGKWIACNMDPCDIPDEIYGSDEEASEFWSNVYSGKLYNSKSIAVGNTKKEAVQNLLLNLNK